MKLENHGEHQVALRELERILEADDSALRRELWPELLAEAIENFEQEHYPLGKPEAFLCPSCGHHAAPVLNKAGDDIACAKCGGPLHGDAAQAKDHR
jgi:hypothetical protein